MSEPSHSQWKCVTLCICVASPPAAVQFRIRPVFVSILEGLKMASNVRLLAAITAAAAAMAAGEGHTPFVLLVLLLPPLFIVFLVYF